MKLSARIPTAAALVLAMASMTGCTKLKARDRLVKGVQEFKAGHYEQATNFFQESIALDPSYDTARLYLATAYSYQVVPNDDSPNNLKVANKALEGFDEVLAKDPNDLVALRQVASIHRNIKQLDKAKADELKVIAADPQDAEANYAIGQMDWSQAYQNSQKALTDAKLTDDGAGNPKLSKDACSKLSAENSAFADESIKYLQEAIQLNPTYDDAMSMLNLAYRQKANIECGNDAARKADLAKADALIQQATAARKANEAAKEKKLGGGVDMSK